MIRILRLSLLLLPFSLAACGSGGSGGASGGAAATLKLDLCSLGCSGGNCAIRTIQVNTDIVLTFNDQVNPDTVTFTEFSIVERDTGSTPPGQFMVSGNQVIFRPAFVDDGVNVSFGFNDSMEYTITLFAAPQHSAVVRSRIGRPNSSPLSCTVLASGIQDFVPGPPIVSVSPNEDEPPTSRSFPVTIQFNDIILSSQLIDAQGQSATVQVTLVTDDGQGNLSEFALPGSFAFQSDLDQRQSTLVFNSTTDFPLGGSGLRWLRVDVSNQISDLVGNGLGNPGSYKIPLMEGSGDLGELVESFNTSTARDDATSTFGLWTGSGFLDSGLDPVTGNHHGGGHGILGFADLAGMVFDTDSMTLDSELLGVPVTLQGAQAGVFFFSGIEATTIGLVSAIGAQPVRIFVRGSAEIQTLFDLSGEDGEVNFALHRPFDERLSFTAQQEPSAAMRALMTDDNEALGGLGGSGKLGGGGGGQGGASWYTFPGYYDDDKVGWFVESSGSGSADTTRYLDGFGGVQVVAAHGTNGDGVGGTAASGLPLGAEAANLVGDLIGGSGMGTWAWPPKTNMFPLESEVSGGDWFGTLNGLKVEAYRASSNTNAFYSRARARGGGGGGFWGDGQRGWVHDKAGAARDPENNKLVGPDLDRWDAPTNWDFNGDRTHNGGGAADEFEVWPSLLMWDDRAGKLIEDGAGGAYRPKVGGNPEPFYTLDPEAGFLRGGGGGGGAGMSQHGSHNIHLSGQSGTVPRQIETYRSGDGAGGGAGGAGMQLHVGNDLTISGQISVAGGDGGSSAFKVPSSFGVDKKAFVRTLPGDAGGGGGAAGSMLLQVGGDLTLDNGALNLQGGSGGTGSVGNHGGDGGYGLLRLETPQTVTLPDLQSVVLPIESFDLADRPEYGLSGANWSSFPGRLPGTVGDLTVPRAVGGGTVTFEGNSSGVGSDWYLAPEAVLFAQFYDYEVVVSWSDGQGGSGVVRYSDINPTTPGITPLWLAMQTSFAVDNNGTIEVSEGSESPWILPGYNTTGGGGNALETAPGPTRAIRFQLVFDHEQIAALIGSSAGATFEVSEVRFLWRE